MTFPISMKTGLTMLCLLCVADVGAIPAQATTTNFTFASPSGILANTQTYTVSGVTLTATGYKTLLSSGNTQTALFGNSGSQWSNGYQNLAGLGLSGYGGANVDSLHWNAYEIAEGTFIQISFSSVFTSLELDMTGVTDGVTVWGSNAAGTLGTQLGVFDNPHTSNSVQITGLSTAYQFYSISATTDCYALLNQVKVGTPTPEPATFALLGLALGVIGLTRLTGLRLDRVIRPAVFERIRIAGVQRR